MSERGAKYAINVFVLITAALVPIAPLLPSLPVTSTFYAGSALVMAYLAANPELLVSGRLERMNIVRRGPIAPVALLAGAALMVVDVVRTWLN